MSNEIIFRIEKHIGTIAEYQTGWTKELNIIYWNDGSPKYDIRDWSPNHEHMTRGITLHKGEIDVLKELLTTID